MISNALALGLALGGMTTAGADDSPEHIDCADTANLNEFGECLGTDTVDLMTGDGHQAWIEGGAGNDWLFGEEGNDELTGGSGRDTLNGGRGQDLVHADDGEKDRIDCGRGKDKVFYDEGTDRVADNCERQKPVV